MKGLIKLGEEVCSGLFPHVAIHCLRPFGRYSLGRMQGCTPPDCPIRKYWGWPGIGISVRGSASTFLPVIPVFGAAPSLAVFRRDSWYVLASNVLVSLFSSLLIESVRRGGMHTTRVKGAEKADSLFPK
jgi:hypothetical protein